MELEIHTSISQTQTHTLEKKKSFQVTIQGGDNPERIGQECLIPDDVPYPIHFRKADPELLMLPPESSSPTFTDYDTNVPMKAMDEYQYLVVSGQPITPKGEPNVLKCGDTIIFNDNPLFLWTIGDVRAKDNSNTDLVYTVRSQNMCGKVRVEVPRKWAKESENFPEIITSPLMN
jgi:hypothetical protein